MAEVGQVLDKIAEIGGNTEDLEEICSNLAKEGFTVSAMNLTRHIKANVKESVITEDHPLAKIVSKSKPRKPRTANPNNNILNKIATMHGLKQDEESIKKFASKKMNDAPNTMLAFAALVADAKTQVSITLKDVSDLIKVLRDENLIKEGSLLAATAEFKRGRKAELATA